MPRPVDRGSRRSKLAERKQTNQTQKQLLIAVIGVVAVLIVLLFIALSGDDPAPLPTPVDTASAATTAKTAVAATTPEPTDPMRARVETILLAVQEGDRDALSRHVSFPRFNDQFVAAGSIEKRWSELDSLGQTLARQKVCELLSADEATREFMRKATIRSYVVMSSDPGRYKAQVIHQHLIEREREQVREIELENVEGSWFLVGIQASAAQTPAEMLAQAERARAEAREQRANRDLAPIEHQEHLEDTPAELRTQIDSLCRTLTDLSLTKEISKAKRELAAIGKPAIPSLLNVIVGREELATHQDQMIINNAVSVLKDITQEDLGYAPGGIGGTMTGDLKKENVEQLMRWFGWWRQNKKSWTGPRESSGEESGG
jgi:hypothetical protein